MSGTSLDGIDVAALTVPYPPAFRERLRRVLGADASAIEIDAVEEELTRRHAAAIAEFRRRHPGVAIDLIGFHGHTVLHRPHERRERRLITRLSYRGCMQPTWTVR